MKRFSIIASANIAMLFMIYAFPGVALGGA